MTQLKVAVFGVFGVGNFGNEATLAVFLQQLRTLRPGVEITCICTQSEQTTTDHQIKTLAMDSPAPQTHGISIAQRIVRRFRRVRLIAEFLRWGRTIACIHNFDSLVIPGTGILDDFATPPSGLPYHLFRWCLAARLCGLPVRMIGVGAGPIVNPTSRRWMTWAAKLASQRSFRDHESKEFMRSLGVATSKDAVVPDLVFSHALATRPNAKDANGTIRIGLGVMAYFGWKGREDEGRAAFHTYIDKLALFSQWLLAQNIQVNLMVGETNDRAAADALLQLIEQQCGAAVRRQIVVKPQNTMEDFLTQVEDLDVLVATRFHNLVGALCRGKPVISIGYASKNDRLMEDFGLGEFCQQIEHLDVPQLKVQFAELRARRHELSERIFDHARQHRETVVEHVKSLC